MNQRSIWIVTTTLGEGTEQIAYKITGGDQHAATIHAAKMRATASSVPADSVVIDHVRELARAAQQPKARTPAEQAADKFVDAVESAHEHHAQIRAKLEELRKRKRGVVGVDVDDAASLLDEIDRVTRALARIAQGWAQ
jgi:hypothetical protein